MLISFGRLRAAPWHLSDVLCTQVKDGSTASCTAKCMAVVVLLWLYCYGAAVVAWPPWAVAYATHAQYQAITNNRSLCFAVWGRL